MIKQLYSKITTDAGKSQSRTLRQIFATPERYPRKQNDCINQSFLSLRQDRRFTQNSISLARKGQSKSLPHFELILPPEKIKHPNSKSTHRITETGLSARKKNISNIQIVSTLLDEIKAKFYTLKPKILLSRLQEQQRQQFSKRNERRKGKDLRSLNAKMLARKKQNKYPLLQMQGVKCKMSNACNASFGRQMKNFQDIIMTCPSELSLSIS